MVKTGWYMFCLRGQDKERSHKILEKSGEPHSARVDFFAMRTKCGSGDEKSEHGE
jgi:hypothetical protein